jgi:hypothetical protein
MELVRVEGLPQAPLDAAAEFHGKWLPLLNPPRSGEDLLLIFPPADHTHRAWRLAAVQELARVAAPRRVNGVATESEQAIAAAAAYLAQALGVTGQYLTLDDAGAGAVLSSAA